MSRSDSVNSVVKSALAEAFASNPEFAMFGDQGVFRNEAWEFSYDKVVTDCIRGVAIWILPVRDEQTYDVYVAAVVREAAEKGLRAFFREEIGEGLKLVLADIPQRLKKLIPVAIERANAIDLAGMGKSL